MMPYAARHFDIYAIDYFADAYFMLMLSDAADIIIIAACR